MNDIQIRNAYILLSPFISALFVVVIILSGAYRMSEAGIGTIICFFAIIHMAASTTLIAACKRYNRTRINSGSLNGLFILILLLLVVALSPVVVNTFQWVVISIISFFVFINLIQS